MTIKGKSSKVKLSNKHPTWFIFVNIGIATIFNNQYRGFFLFDYGSQDDFNDINQSKSVNHDNYQRLFQGKKI